MTKAELFNALIKAQKQENQKLMAAIDDAVAALTATVVKVGASASTEIKAVAAAIAAALAKGGTPQAVTDAVTAQVTALGKVADTLDAETVALGPIVPPPPGP